MKLQLPNRKIERSQDFEDVSFGIGDPVVILDYMRNKMYSDPIGIVCQEYASNAKDAHIEAGKPDEPIVIKLPNTLDPTYKVQDFGLGMGHDKIKTVYSQYGISTKRSSDDQIGGFGLGCKCAFSYCDNFIICSIHHEMFDGEMVNVERQYAAYIDESQTGVISLVSGPKVTDKPTGTTIIIAVKNEHEFNTFKRKTLSATYWWKNRPIIKGIADFEWGDAESSYEGNGWKLLKKVECNDTFTFSTEPVAILDGIPYPINFNKVYENEECPEVIEKLKYSKLRIFFDTGQLQVVPSRESLSYSDVVKQTLRNRLIEIGEELEKTIQDEFTGAHDYHQALLIWKNLDPSHRYLATWNDRKFFHRMEIPDRYWKKAADRNKIYLYKRDEENYARKASYREWSIPIREDVLIIEKDKDDDTKHPSISKMHTLVQQYPNIDEFFVVRVSDNDRKHLQDNYHWDELVTIKLSEVERTSRKSSPSPKGTYKVERVKIYTGDKQFDSTDVELDEDEALYYGILYRNKLYPPSNLDDYHFNFDDLEWIRYQFDVEIYGVKKQFIKKINDEWIPITDLLREKIEEIENNETFIKYKDLQYSYFSNDNVLYKIIFNKKYLDQILDPRFKELKSLHQNAQAVQDLQNQWLRLKRIVGDPTDLNPNRKFDKLRNELRGDYSFIHEHTYRFQVDWAITLINNFYKVSQKNVGFIKQMSQFAQKWED